MATDFTPIPDWLSSGTQGAGVAVADLDGSGRPGVLVLMVGPHGASYRVSPNGVEDAAGAAWSDWTPIPDWHGGESADGAIAVADLDGDGRPELVVLAVEAGGGASFRIGRALDADGEVTGGWSAWQAIPDWPAEENRGGDIALADLGGDDRRALVVVTVAGTAGESRGRYRVGRGLDADGSLAGGWGRWTTIPDWRPDPGHGVGADVGDLDGDGRPDLIVVRVADGESGLRGRHTVGWGLDADGGAADGWGPWTDLARWSPDTTRGAAASLVAREEGARPDLVTLTVTQAEGRDAAVQHASQVVLDVDLAPTQGVWRLLDFDSQILAVHAALLRTGDVLFFAGSGADRDDHEAHRYRTRVWHYPSRRFTAPRTPRDLFCAGQSFLQGGRLLVAGGTSQYGPFRGIRAALDFSPTTLRWTRVRPMRRPRWYPALITLGDGRIISVSGRGADGTIDRVPEIFERGRGWKDLPSPGLLPWYCHLFLLGDGRVFYSGGQMSGNRGARPVIWDIATGHTTVVPGLPMADLRNQAASVILPPAQAQRVMIVGGGGRDIHQHEPDPSTARLPHVATRSCAIADLSDPTPRYSRTAPLHQARMHLNATILADRTVVATGGAAVQEHRADAALNAEIYHPRVRTWTLAAKSRVPRLYHSTALLTQDGKIVTAGSNPMPQDDELRIEVFWPPYLFRGPRPRCTLTAHRAGYGGRLTATTDDPARLREVNLVRAGATTHAFNTEQRLLDVPFEVVGPERIALRMPTRRNLAPPGWYLVFLVDTDGVPSIGRWVRLG